jgi:hypothetical protein
LGALHPRSGTGREKRLNFSYPFTGHDRWFIERVANRWWWINAGVLEDLYNPQSTLRR